MLRCLNVTAHTDARFGGLTATLPRFCQALESTNSWLSPLVAFCAEDESADPGQSHGLEFDRFPSGWRLWAARTRWLQRLESHIRAADVVHIHGLWQQHTAWTAAACRKIGRPYIISAHGMLEPWALAHRGLKKQLYLRLVEGKNLREATCLRALTRDEVADYRRLGMRNPCSVVPNGIDLPLQTDPTLFWNLYPELQGKRILLFLGRIHPKKGLDLLFKVWNSLGNQYADARLVIAGPDEAAMQQQLKQILTSHHARASVLFTGILEGPVKSSALAAAHLFVLPSYSEGFSVAILEALAHGRPVLISKACHFPEVAEANCGWVIDPDFEALNSVLKCALTAPEGEMKSMGQNGLLLIQDRFHWPAVSNLAREMTYRCTTENYPQKREFRQRGG